MEFISHSSCLHIVQVSEHTVYQEEQANRGRPAVWLWGSGHERAAHGDRGGTNSSFLIYASLSSS